MRRSFRRRAALRSASAVCLLAVLRMAYLPWYPLWQSAGPKLLAPGVYQTKRVTADRVQLYDPHNPAAQAEIKLLGIRAPVRASTSEGTRFLRKLITDGEVRLRLDRRRMDGNGTQLGYLYVRERLINAEVVRQGFAIADTRRGDCSAVVRQLEAAQREAKLAGRGIWRRDHRRPRVDG